jgi:hypothetical protein
MSQNVVSFLDYLKPPEIAPGTPPYAELMTT